MAVSQFRAQGGLGVTRDSDQINGQMVNLHGQIKITFLIHSIENVEVYVFKSINVRLYPDEYRQQRGRGRQRHRSLLYDWIVSRAMGALFKTESDYFLGVLLYRVFVIIFSKFDILNFDVISQQ